MWKCLECGRKFKTVKSAERAANDGCPGCGGVDIDIDVGERERSAQQSREQTESRTEDNVTERLKRIFLTRKPKEDKQ